MPQRDVAADEPIGFHFHPDRDPEYYSTWAERERRERHERLLALGIDPALIPPPRAATEEEVAEIPRHPIKSVRMGPDGRVTFVALHGSRGNARPREQRARRSGSPRRGPPSARSGDEPPPLDHLHHPGLVVGVPALVVRVELEAAPQAYFDCVNEGEERRLRDWLAAHPGLLDGLLSIVAGEG